VHRLLPRSRRISLPTVALVSLAACVPPGNSTPSDAGAPVTTSTAAPTVARPVVQAMTAPFEDNFDRPNTHMADGGAASAVGLGAKDAAASSDGGKIDGAAADAGILTAPAVAAAPAGDLGPNWTQAGTTAWRIENGKLCGQGAKNHGVWLNKVLPVNARIEFDASSDSQDGDMKAEVWGDGQSAATSLSYTNATSYLAILGGWHNKFHVLARINEHGDDRKEIKVDKESDDPRQKPVTRGQTYHFKIERTDSKTVRWSIDGVEMAAFVDDAPLLGPGHDHFGFNDWDAKVCFDNVRVTPISAL
jgi:hypothetical protein